MLCGQRMCPYYVAMMLRLSESSKHILFVYIFKYYHVSRITFGNKPQNIIQQYNLFFPLKFPLSIKKKQQKKTNTLIPVIVKQIFLTQRYAKSIINYQDNRRVSYKISALQLLVQEYLLLLYQPCSEKCKAMKHNHGLSYYQKIGIERGQRDIILTFNREFRLLTYLTEFLHYGAIWNSVFRPDKFCHLFPAFIGV